MNNTQKNSANSQRLCFDHINLSTRNFDESAKWYQEIFGFEVVQKGKDENGNAWGIVRKDDSMLCLYEDQGLKAPQEGGAHHQIYHFGIRLKDAQAWTRLISEKKLNTFFGSPRKYPHSLSWYVEDPSGHTIEVAFWNNDQIIFTPMA